MNDEPVEQPKTAEFGRLLKRLIQVKEGESNQDEESVLGFQGPCFILLHPQDMGVPL
jgi:hypothetical protein